MSSLLGRTAQLQPYHRSPHVHELADTDRNDLRRLVDTDPIANAVFSSRLYLHGSLDPKRFGGGVLGVRDMAGRLTGAAFSGGNLLPVGGGPAEWNALGRYLANRRRVCSSLVGRVAAVAGLWEVLAPTWGPARAVRAEQPLLLVDGESLRAHRADPRLRMIRPLELDAYLAAAEAMFTEELGITPQHCAGTGDYRGRVAGLIRDGRAFGVVDRRGDVVFKADVGAISPHTCQLQGVWVRPDLRGQGLGTAALAAVLSRGLTLAPTVSLYVNDFNVAARRMYDRLGMRQVATLSTVLF